MALVLADRVQETSTSVGTGTFTLAGAVNGFQSFAVIGNANTTYYVIAGGNEWEVGIGTYTSSGTTLSRDTVLSSSNSNAKVDFSAGVKYVFVSYPEERAVYVNGTSVVIPNSATVPIASGGTGATTLAGANIPVTNASNTFTSAQTFRAANAVRSEAASAQDAVVLAGRAGGTASYAVTLTPTTLSASRTLTLPDASGTVLQSGTAVTVAQGGTGLTSGTSGGIPFFSSTSAMTSSAALAANALVVGGGAGVAPSTVTTGANVLTALGVAVGSSGAFTTNNAANTFTAAQTFRAANAIRSEAASTQDAMILAGRAGGTGSFAVTLTPTTLTASRTVTFPDAATSIPVATQTLTFSGPTAARTYTLPDASTTLLSTNAAVTVAQGGTGLTTLTAYGLLAAGTTSTGNLQQVSGTGTSGQVLTSNGAGALPTWQTSSGASKGFSQIMAMVFGI